MDNFGGLHRHMSYLFPLREDSFRQIIQWIVDFGLCGTLGLEWAGRAFAFIFFFSLLVIYIYTVFMGDTMC